MDNATPNVTPAEIAKVETLKSQCRAQFKIDDFITILTKFYQLLMNMGFWPDASLQIPSPDSTSIDVNLARDLGYSELAIDIIQRLPYPNDRVIYDHELRLVEDTRILDLRDEEDLRLGRHPEGRDFEDSPKIEAWIITLMAPFGQEGSVVLLDVNLGAIYLYKTVYGPPSATLTHRVQTYLSQPNTPPEHLCYHFATPFPATAYIQSLHDAYFTLQRIPFLDPRYENDMSADIEGLMNDEYESSFMRRRQETVRALYAEMGWPGEDFDRDGLRERWKGLEEGFRRERIEKTREREEAEEWEDWDGREH